jgi:endonuclease/exonuclease/phosphatase (EEP) superfamily protein YafD
LREHPLAHLGNHDALKIKLKTENFKLTPRTSRVGRWLRGGVWAYFLALVALWLWLRYAGEHEFWATVALYGPRWVWAVPLLVLVPAAACYQRRTLGLLGLSAVLVAGPIMGFQVPWRTWLDGGPPSPLHVRVLTCNVDGEFLNAKKLDDLIMSTWPDIVALQEWSSDHEKTLFREKEWQVRTYGGGLCFASRFPIRKAESLKEQTIPAAGGFARFELDTPAGNVTFFNVHLPTPGNGFGRLLDEPFTGGSDYEESIHERWQAAFATSESARRASGPVLIAGDFNMTPDSAIYRECWSSYTNAFSTAGFGLGHSRILDYWGARIDQQLAGPGWRCRRCWVGPDVESDHRPVIADWDWVGKS